MIIQNLQDTSKLSRSNLVVNYILNEISKAHFKDVWMMSTSIILSG